MAGYSSKNIIDKLGVKSGMQAVVMRAPEDYAEVLGEIAARAELKRMLGGRLDFIQYFARSEEQLEAVMGNLAAHIVPNGMVWVSWAKRSSPLNTGLDDNKVRRIGLDAGLVDVKVAAVSEDWSGMKFVRRLADR
jgi:hypothetical protein